MRTLFTFPRLVAFVSLALAALMIGAPAADASRANTTNTTRQVVVNVGGSEYYIDITIDQAVARCINGPVDVVVTVPSRTRASVVSVGQGFGRSGINVSIVSGAEAGTITVSVNVPSARSGWTEVGVASADGFAIAAPGETNSPTEVVTYTT